MYKLLAVFFIVWFCYLPLVVLIAIPINPLERLKVISTLELGVDFLANTAMVVLFCPQWSDLYFQFNSHINQLARLSFELKDQSLKSYGSSSSVASLTASHD